MTGDDFPGGGPKSNGIDLNNGGWVFITILICIILVLAITFYIRSLFFLNKINSLKALVKNELTDEEIKLLCTYRGLNDRDKTVIKSTLKTLSKNDEQQKE